MQKELKPSEKVFTPSEIDWDCPFWVQVWKHSNERRSERRKARIRRARERQLHIAGAIAGISLLLILAAAVLAGLL